MLDDNTTTSNGHAVEERDNEEEGEKSITNHEDTDCTPSITVEFHNVPYLTEQTVALYLQDLLSDLIYKQQKKHTISKCSSNRKITVYSDFIIDPHPNRMTKRDAQQDDLYNDRMIYERSFDHYDPIKEVVVAAVNKCWNCGRPDHEARKCPFRMDREEFQKNREAFQFSRNITTDSSFGRFYPEERKQRRRNERERTPIEVNTEENATEHVEYTPIENKIHVQDVGRVDDEFLYGGKADDSELTAERRARLNNLMSLMKNRSKHEPTQGASSFIQIPELQVERKREEDHRDDRRRFNNHEGDRRRSDHQYRDHRSPRSYDDRRYSDRYNDRPSSDYRYRRDDREDHYRRDYYEPDHSHRAAEQMYSPNNHRRDKPYEDHNPEADRRSRKRERDYDDRGDFEAMLAARKRPKRNN